MFECHFRYVFAPLCIYLPFTYQLHNVLLYSLILWRVVYGQFYFFAVAVGDNFRQLFLSVSFITLTWSFGVKGFR